MKKTKFFLIAYLFLLTMVSCQKEESQLIDGKTANERYTAYIAEVKANLISSEGGWIGMLKTPRNGNGFVVFLDFKEGGRVSMYSDFNATTMNEIKESSFTFRNTGKPSLIFDTYNYIHLLSDPNSDVNGGTSGAGLYADFEFSIIKSTVDTIVLKGNLNGNDFVLTKLSKEERTLFVDGKLEANIGKYLTYFNALENAYVNVAIDGQDKQLAIDVIENRRLSYQALEGQEIKNFNGPLYAGVNDMKLGKENTYKGITFVKAFFKETDKVFFVDTNGKEYELLQSSSPIIPLPPFLNSFGEDKRYFSAEFRPTMANALFKPIWDNIQNESVTAANRHIGYIRMTLLKNGELYLRVYRYGVGAGTTGSASFSRLYFKPVANVDGTVSYTYISTGSDGGASSSAVRNTSKVLENFLKDNKFTWDWRNKGMTEGGLFVVDDQLNKTGVAFTGTLGTN